MVSGVTPALVWVPLGGSFVIGLAAVARMAAPAPAGGDVITGTVRLPEPLTATIVTLFFLAGLVFLTDLYRRAVARRRDEEDEGADDPGTPPVPAWMRTLTQILSLVYFVVVAYLLWRGGLPLAGVMSLGHGAAPAIGGAPSGPGPEAPPFVTWTFGALALAAGLGALALALWVAFGARLSRVDATAAGGEAEPLGAAVEESLEDLRAEPDPRRAIIRCYARFERVAAESGVARLPWSTPMEFMGEALGRLPVPRAAVPALTGLFELARFSHHPLGTPERDRALAALDEIRTAIEQRHADALR
jgi:hypothetical protein